MKHRPVITSAKSFANGVERAFSKLPGQKHGDLSREGDVFRAALAGHVRQPDVKMFGHLFLDHFDADREPPLLMQDFPQQTFHDLDR
jgi:hypothetical protein